MKKPSSFTKNAVAIIFFMVFLYLMVLLNLYKSTHEIEWNIFKSEALPEFLIFAAVALPIIIAIQVLWKKVVKKEKNSEKNEKNQIESTE